MTIVTVSKSRIIKDGGVVILPVEEYKKLSERAVPTYYLAGEKAIALDRLVSRGIKDYKKGKCKTIKSLADIDV